MVDSAIGAYARQGSSELGLLRGLSTAFAARDVMLANSFYCNYGLVATFASAGVDIVSEQHGARVTDFRRGQPLGARDHRIFRLKPIGRLPWTTHEQYAAFPDELTLREVKVDGQILVTTILNPRAVRKGQLAELYGQHWNVELDLRNRKTALRMEVLSCQTPGTIETELCV